MPTVRITIKILEDFARSDNIESNEIQITIPSILPFHNHPSASNKVTSKSINLLSIEPQETTPSILRLPDHLLRSIADNLNRQDGCAFATTSKVVYRVIEPMLWRELRISLNAAKNDSSNDLWSPKDVICGQTIKQLSEIQLLGNFNSSCNPEDREDRGGIKHHHGKDLYTLREFSVHEIPFRKQIYHQYKGDYLARFHNHLTGYLTDFEGRARCVQTLQLDSDLAYTLETVKLLNVIQPNLRKLEFYHSTSRHFSFSGDSIHFHPYQLFSKLEAKLDNLVYLRFVIDGKMWEQQMKTVFNATPNLRFLKLSTTNPYCGKWGRDTIFRDAKEDDRWPTLPKLEEFEIEQVYNGMNKMLKTLFKAGERLKKVVIGDPEFRWQEDKEVLEVLAEHPKLECLVATSLITLSMKKIKGFKTLKMMTIFQDNSFNIECPLQTMAFPACSQVETLTIVPTTFEAKIPFEVPVTAPQGITLHLANQIIDCPRLTYIRFPKSQEAAIGYVQTESIHLPSDDCSVAQVSTWTHPENSNALIEVCMSYYHPETTDLQRVTYAYHEGHQFSMKQLEKVHEANGQFGISHRGSRGKPLSPNAWKILEELKENTHGVL